MRERLDAIGFDVWWDLQDAPSGEVHSVVRKAVAECDAAILVLAQWATRWVKYEAQLVLEREESLGRPLLCPIALDACWRVGWKPPLRSWIEEYVVLDFSDWSRPETFAAQFHKLVRGLGTHYDLVAPAVRRRPSSTSGAPVVVEDGSGARQAGRNHARAGVERVPVGDA